MAQRTQVTVTRTLDNPVHLRYNPPLIRDGSETVLYIGSTTYGQHNGYLHLLDLSTQVSLT